MRQSHRPVVVYTIHMQCTYHHEHNHSTEIPKMTRLHRAISCQEGLRVLRLQHARKSSWIQVLSYPVFLTPWFSLVLSAMGTVDGGCTSFLAGVVFCVLVLCCTRARPRRSNAQTFRKYQREPIHPNFIRTDKRANRRGTRSLVIPMRTAPSHVRKYVESSSETRLSAVRLCKTLTRSSVRCTCSLLLCLCASLRTPSIMTSQVADEAKNGPMTRLEKASQLAGYFRAISPPAPFNSTEE